MVSVDRLDRLGFNLFLLPEAGYSFELCFALCSLNKNLLVNILYTINISSFCINSFRLGHPPFGNDMRCYVQGEKAMGYR